MPLLYNLSSGVVNIKNINKIGESNYQDNTQ